jgi:hypothetical protein
VSKNDYGFNIPVFIVNEKRESVSRVNAIECSGSTGLSPDLVQVGYARSLGVLIRSGFRGVVVNLVQLSIQSDPFRIVENEKEFAIGAALAIFESKEQGHRHSPMALSNQPIYFCLDGGTGTMPSRS